MIGIVEEEVGGTIYWLESSNENEMLDSKGADPLMGEAQELSGIAISSITKETIIEKTYSSGNLIYPNADRLSKNRSP